MEWFREAFDVHYLTLYSRRDGKEAQRQVAFAVEQLPLRQGALVLDLGCGSGRHAVELSRRGINVLCLDLSLPLLKQARDAGNKSAFWKVRADMRYLPARGKFDAVLSFFTSFGYFDDTRHDQLVLAEVARALRPGGGFLLDLLNPHHVRENLVPYSEEGRGEMTIRQWRWYNPETRRVEKEVRFDAETGTTRVRESVRCYTLDELRDRLERAGLGLEHVYGDFDGRPYSETSPRLICIARKLEEATR